MIGVDGGVRAKGSRDSIWGYENILKLIMMDGGGCAIL